MTWLYPGTGFETELYAPWHRALLGLKADLDDKITLHYFLLAKGEGFHFTEGLSLQNYRQCLKFFSLDKRRTKTNLSRNIVV